MPENIADLTPDELRRRIAEKLGWRSRFEVSELTGELWGYKGQCDDEPLSLVPDWPGGLNAAIELLPIQRTVSVGRDADAPLWWCAIKRKSGEVEAREHGPDPAMACARAWLAWREAHVEKGEGNA